MIMIMQILLSILDCSNPIFFRLYMNKDILTNYAVSQDANTVSFNGRFERS